MDYQGRNIVRDSTFVFRWKTYSLHNQSPTIKLALNIDYMLYMVCLSLLSVILKMERRVMMSKFVVYTRVSILDEFWVKQDRVLKEQKDKILQRLGEYDKYHKEFYSDKGIESPSSHPELTKAIDNMQPGDTLVVLSLDKLGLSLTKLIKLFIELDKKNIDFISLEEGISTRMDGKFLFRISNSVIKCERKLRSERGILSQLNKTSLKRGGRKPLDKELIKILLRRHFIDNEKPAKIIYMDLGISHRTFYKYAKKHKYDYREFLEGKIP